jgi:hypothetical protein
MSSRNDNTRAQALVRLPYETPVADESLLPLQEEVDAIVRKARDREPSETADVVSPVIDDIARAYFRYVHRRQLARLKALR